MDPEGGKKHPRFNEVKDVELTLLDRDVQLDGRSEVRQMSIGEAVATRLVDNETLGYFMSRIREATCGVSIPRLSNTDSGQY